MSYIKTIKLVLTGFEAEGDIARVRGAIVDKYFEAPLLPGTLLIREDGRWKWYGNQKPRIEN
jgi:hypothetical protein